MDVDAIKWMGCEFVERVPGRMGGVPVVVGSRVTPESLLENFEDFSAHEVAEMFGLAETKVHGVLAFASHRRVAA